MHLLRFFSGRALLAGVSVACALSAPAARAAGIDPDAATPVQREQAQARFVRGKQLYTHGDYAAALDNFHASMEIVASPNARLYAARCLRESGRLVEAYVEFGRTEVEAREQTREDPRYARTGPAAASEREALAPKLGFLSVHLQHAGAETTMRIAHDEIRRAAWGEPAPVMPGVTEIAVESPPAPPIRRSISLAAGETKALDIDLEASSALPPAPSTPPTARASSGLPVFAYAAGGLGAAGLITFGIAGLLSDSTYSDLRAHCPGGGCPPGEAAEISRGRTEQAIADAGLAIGIVGAAVFGSTLIYVKLQKGKETSAPTETTLVVSPVGTGIRGTF